nr:hypothetical protein [Desulfobulbaceae bacterium]
MDHQTATNHYRKHNNSCDGAVSSRLAGKIVSDIDWLELLAYEDNFVIGSFNRNLIDPDSEHLFRQRWKIE